MCVTVSMPVVALGIVSVDDIMAMTVFQKLMDRME